MVSQEINRQTRRQRKEEKSLGAEERACVPLKTTDTKKKNREIST